VPPYAVEELPLTSAATIGSNFGPEFSNLFEYQQSPAIVYQFNATTFVVAYSLNDTITPTARSLLPEGFVTSNIRGFVDDTGAMGVLYVSEENVTAGEFHVELFHSADPTQWPTSPVRVHTYVIGDASPSLSMVMLNNVLPAYVVTAANGVYFSRALNASDVAGGGWSTPVLVSGSAEVGTTFFRSAEALQLIDNFPAVVWYVCDDRSLLGTPFSLSCSLQVHSHLKLTSRPSRSCSPDTSTLYAHTHTHTHTHYAHIRSQLSSTLDIHVYM
jgi:hypothetical protein